jgi:hypothetical protein
MLNPREQDLDEAVALCELRRDTLYRQLIKLEDDQREVHPGCIPEKQRALERAVAHNPLAAAMVERRPLHSDHPLLAGRPFIGQPVTCFGVHEVLRRTRFHRDFADGCSPGVITLGAERVTHDQLLGWLTELIPNLNLRRVYDRTFLLENPAVAPVLAGILVGCFVATDAEPGQWLHVIGAGVLGAIACGLILFYLNRSKYGRQLHQTAPWNSSLYVDINLALLRDHPHKLHLGYRARLPRPQIAGWKVKSRYYPLAQQVIDGTYTETLQAPPGYQPRPAAA